jgi:hypothetical protein
MMGGSSDFVVLSIIWAKKDYKYLGDKVLGKDGRIYKIKNLTFC